VREVGGLTYALGEYARDFPRLLAIDLSVDRSRWSPAWEGPNRGAGDSRGDARAP
jgi:hypothetical protein